MVEATRDVPTESTPKLTVLPPTALVVGGVFNLPSDLSGGVPPGAILGGWLVTGVGMLMLAFVYPRLAVRKPEVKAEVHAKAGVGVQR